MTSHIERRLREWAGWLHSPSYNAYPSTTVEWRIFTERENAGARGDGMRYEVLDGVVCRPDGGMSQHAMRAGRILALDARCHETHKAIEILPGPMRLVVVKRHVRPDRRDKPMSFRALEGVLGEAEETLRDRYNAAARRLDRSIYGPFVVQESALEAPAQKAA
jgi:hypothetical protein